MVSLAIDWLASKLADTMYAFNFAVFFNKQSVLNFCINVLLSTKFVYFDFIKIAKFSAFVIAQIEVACKAKLFSMMIRGAQITNQIIILLAKQKHPLFVWPNSYFSSYLSLYSFPFSFWDQNLKSKIPSRGVKWVAKGHKKK